MLGGVLNNYSLTDEALQSVDGQNDYVGLEGLIEAGAL